MRGRVKWFSEPRKFGFITRDDGGDVFFHASALPPGLAFLETGERVQFDVAEAPKGPVAQHVTLVSDEREPQTAPVGELHAESVTHAEPVARAEPVKELGLSGASGASSILSL
jgi:cold shock CspA family protein